MNFAAQNPLSISSLSAAVKENNVKIVRNLLKKGRNVNIVDNRGWTPFHEAAALGNVGCLKILLNAGARVDATTHQGETALFIACENCHLDSVKILLKFDKKTVNISNNESVTPLHVACSKHSVSIAELLLKNNASINAEDNGGITPLHEAILSKNFDICKLLVESGANLNRREYDGNLPFHFACMVGNMEIMNLLLNCYKTNFKNVINDTNCDGFTPLMLAVQGECIEIVNELLSRGADPNIASKEKTLALHLALHTGSVELLQSIYHATSKDAINKCCTTSEDELQNYSKVKNFPIKSLLCLAIDSSSTECFEFILNCGVCYDVLNCPVIQPRDHFGEFIYDMQFYGIHDYLTADRYLGDRVVLHPISFLLLEYFELFTKKDVLNYLKIMLRSGLIFDNFNYETDAFVLHPLVILIIKSMSMDDEKKKIAVECFKLLLEYGVSVDYKSITISPVNPIPILFVLSCRIGFLEIIPYLLKYSNTVEIDDILKWIVSDLLKGFHEDDLIETYEFLRKYTSTPILSVCKTPDNENKINQISGYFKHDTYTIPCLKTICRNVIRKTIRDSCQRCPHQFKVRLNSLGLPASLLSFMNYDDLLNYVTEKSM